MSSMLDDTTGSDRPRGTQSASAGVAVALCGLRKSYREGEHRREVLRGVDAQLNRGECVALLGRSGSGKSTLLNLISGIDSPTAGRVLVDGSDITQLTEPKLTLFRRKHIGFVYQFFNLIPTLTVLENVRLPMELNGRPDSAPALALLAEVGLAGRTQAYPDQLSGGEQQRVAITRALVHNPLLVLADEPTGNMDEETGRKVLALLDRLVRRLGRTMIISTHSAEVARFADRVLKLEEGRLVERGHEAA